MARPLTDAERARVRAHMDHLDKAMAVVTESEFDPDKVNAAHEAAARACPVSKEVFQAYSAEVLTEMADPLRVLNDLSVYRASYNDDAAWHRILSVLRRDIESSLAVYQAQPGLLARHELVVMDDQSRFEGAGPEKIREHFDSWAVDELQRNWRADREPATKDEITGAAGSTDYLHHAGSRYNFFLLVDDICLESIEMMDEPVFKLVKRNWAPDSEGDEAEEDEEDEKFDWEGGETNSDHEDVGWMYVDTSDYVDVQDQLQEGDCWPELYVRPPLMRWEYDVNRAPGFWRRNASSA
ncbi:unnamed protein product [Alternaria alternata]